MHSGNTNKRKYDKALHLLEDNYADASWCRAGHDAPLQHPFTTFVEGVNASPIGTASKSTCYDNARVYLDTSQRAESCYFHGVPEHVRHFHIGGYQVCHKWLYDRRGKRGEPGRTLTEDEMHYFQPGDFQAYYADFSEIEEAERYVRLVRDVVDGLLDRARRPGWEARIRDRWPQVVALLQARSPKTAEMIPLDALGVEVSGTHLAIRGVVERSGLEYHCQAIMAAIRREVPEVPREFTARFGVIIG